jgi:hypothetical protein
MNLIIDTVNSYLPPKRKVTPSGWISFNAVCCQHNGNSMDTRQRGGIMLKDNVSYHCFNCGFKASWQPGRKLSVKFKKFLRWLNVSDDLITKCSIEAMRLEENTDYQSQRSVIPEFIDKALPLGAEPIASFLDNPPEELMLVLEYMLGRGLVLEDYPFYWTPEDGFNNRSIVPFYYQNRCVGYTARLIRDGKIKYISEQQPGYVFNLDRQIYDRKFVVVVEGPIDAICIDAVALTGSEVGPVQQMLINQLQREVIVVPDRDQAGSKLVEQALEFGWSVSFPEWGDGVKDINDACQKYGRLYTLYAIVQAKESNNLKIQLRAKTWFPKEEK